MTYLQSEGIEIDPNMKLINVQMYHRHGSRTPVTILRKDNHRFETQLWTSLISDMYSPLPSDYSHEMPQHNGSKIAEQMYSWKNVSSRLRMCYLSRRKDNFSLDSEVLIDSRLDPMSKHKLLNDHTTEDEYKYAYLGKLTDNGVNQMEAIGLWLRERYINDLKFLDSNDTRKLWVQSTNFNRTIFSVDSLLYGLYGKCDGGTQSQSDIQSQLIAIHVDTKDKTCLFPNKYICPKYDELLSDAYHLVPERKRVVKIANRICEFYDLDPNGRYSMSITSSLMCRAAYGADLPSNVTPNELQLFINYVANRRSKVDGMNKSTLQMSCGVQLYHLMDNLTNDSDLFRILSCHDTSIISLLAALNVLSPNDDFVSEWPKYGASLIFETYQNIKDNCKFIRILYCQRVLKLNNKEYIDLREFEKYWKDIMIDESSYLRDICGIN